MYTFKTPDVALATTLSISGFKHDEFSIVPGSEGSMGRPLAEFVYKRTDRVSDFQAVIDGYNDGLARVEPQMFALEFRKCRDRLFNFLQTR